MKRILPFILILSAILPQTFLLSQIPTTGLVAYYPFNGNANDESGNTNNGTVLEALPSLDRRGNTNSAYSFDGINDNITIPDATSLRGGDNFSIALWIKTTTSAYSQLIAKGNDSQANHWGIFYNGNNKDIIFQFRDNYSTFSVCILTANKDLSDNRWHHISGIFENKVLKLFIDGKLLSSKDASSLTYNYDNTNPVTIGYQNLASYYYYFNGSIDDIRLYNRALTENEIILLYNEGGWPPSITEFTPRSAVPGATVAISGNNFNPDPAGNIVYFGPVKAEVLSATFTSLTVKVPVGATFSPISVTDAVSHLTARSLLQFTPLPPVASTDISFQSPFTITHQTGAYNTERTKFTDLDGDGLTDIIVNNGESPSFSVRRNISSVNTFRFENEIVISTGNNLYTLVTCDVDCDGKQDVIVSEIGSNSPQYMFRNISTPGNISFSPKIDIISLPSKIQSEFADFDNDGKPDIVTSNHAASLLTIKRNLSESGTITFGPDITFPTASIPGYLEVYDFDGDALTDIAVSNYSSGSVSIFRNTSTGQGSISFAPRVDIAFGSLLQGIDAGDINADSKIDLVVVLQDANSFKALENTSTPGNISFSPSISYPIGTNAVGILLSDMNGDSKLDVAVSGDVSTSIYTNTTASGSISFGSKKTLPYATGALGLYDMDNEKALDLVGLSYNSGNIYIFRNNIQDIVSSGLVAYYPFNGNAIDESWNGINGTVSGATNITDRFGISNKAYSFDGVNDGIEYGSVNIPINNFSASLWFNPKAFESSDELLYNADASNGFNIFLEPNYTLGFIVVASSSSSNMIQLNLGESSLNQWIHLVAISNNGVIKLYINGELKATQSGVLGVNSSNTLHSGYDYGANNYFYNGLLDDIRIYNRTLSETEILSLYHENNWGLQPTIASFTPASGPVGTSVTITGTNFSATPSENIVWFGAVKGQITASTSTSITVNVPAGATYQPVSVTVNGLTGYSTDRFIVTFPSEYVINSSSFSPKTDFAGGGAPFNIAIGDLDGDGKPDMVTANYNSSNISIYRNISTLGTLDAGSFESRIDIPTDGEAYFISLSDVDGDGKKDIIVSVGSAHEVSVLRNISTAGSLSSGSFNAKVDFSSGLNPFGLDVEDLDGDGKPEIITANFASSTISILKNISTPGIITTDSFAPKVDIGTGTEPYFLTIDDFDRDGKKDIAVSSYGSNTVSVLRNISSSGIITSGSFATKVDFATGLNPIGIASGDIDGDSKPDLAVAVSGANTVSIFRNTAAAGTIDANSFASKIDFSCNSVTAISLSDIDGDSKPDIAVSNYGNGTTTVYKNTSTAGSMTSESLSTGTTFTSGSSFHISMGDLDGDGKPDLTGADHINNQIHILKNNISSIIIPSAPVIGTTSQPTCSLSTGSVVLNGLPSSGTWILTRNPGGITQAGTGTSITISGLPEGTYSYTVTNSQGGTSASSANIVINAQPPTPSAPVAGTVTQPTCSISTGSVELSGLPASGTWTLTRSPGEVNSNGTGTTLSITGLVAGTYSYTVTNAYGCISIASADVIINAQPETPTAPVVGTITHPTCTTPAGSVVLNSLPSSGSWTLTRSPGNITISGSGSSITIEGLLAGIYTYTVSGSSGCISAVSSEVEINTQPTTPSAPVVGTITQPDCNVRTGSATLSGLPSTGTWTLTKTTDNSVSNGSGTTASLTGLTEGTYNYTVTNAAGCVSSASANIVINAPPEIPSAPTALNIVQPTCLSASGSISLGNLPSTGSWTINISSGGSTTGNGTSALLSALAPGTYSFLVTNESGCISASLSNIAIQPVPKGYVPVIEMKWNSVLVGFNLNNEFTSWQWFRETTPLTGATDKAFFDSKGVPGQYRVLVTDKDGCQNYSNYIEIIQGTKSVTAYPNPSDQSVTLSITDANMGRALITVFSEIGIKVSEFNAEKNDELMLVEIPVNKLKEGIYYVKVSMNNNELYFEKIIVAR